MLVTTAEQADGLRSLLLRSAADAAYRQRIVSDPGAVLTSVGVGVPADVVVRPVEDTRTLRHIVLPTPPAEGAVMDDELADATGGIPITLPILGAAAAAALIALLGWELNNG